MDRGYVGGDRARSLRRGAVSLGVVVALMGAVAVYAGPGRIEAALSEADAATLGMIVGVAAVVLLVRGLTLRVILDVLGHRMPTGRAVYVHAATAAISTFIPGGRAGGAPINGYLISRSADADYEDGIAAVIGTTALGNLAVGLAGVFGVGYLLATATGENGIETPALLGAAVFGLAAVGVVVLWRVRGRAGTVVATAITRLGRVAAVLPGLSAPDRDDVTHRLARFADPVDRLRDGTPRQFVMLVGLPLCAHALTVLALWLSFAAVGESVSIGVVAAVIPAGVAAAIVPTPGGVGSIDVMLVGLLTTGTGAALPVAAAAMVVYRTAMMGPALLVGGGALAALLSTGPLGDAPGH